MYITHRSHEKLAYSDLYYRRYAIFTLYFLVSIVYFRVYTACTSSIHCYIASTEVLVSITFIVHSNILLVFVENLRAFTYYELYT
jgi:hypothetical protein